MLASYLLSRTLVPTLASMLLAHEAPEGEHHDEAHEPQAKGRGAGLWSRANRRRQRALDRLRDAYGAVLDVAIARRAFVLIAAALFVGVSALLYGEVGLDFFPTVDAGLMRLHFHAPAGTRIERTEVLVDEAERTIRGIVPPSELETIDDNIGVPIFYNLGFVPTNNANDADAEITVALKPGHHATAGYQDRIRAALRDQFSGATAYFEQADIVSQVLNFGTPSQVDVQVQARRYEQAVPIALQLERAIRGIPGTVDVRLGQEIEHPALRVDVDRERALQLGLTEQNVAGALLTSLASSSLASPNFWVDPKNGVNYTVAVQTPIYHVAELPSLTATPVTASSAGAIGASMPAGFGAPAPTAPPLQSAIAPYLGSIASVHAASTRASIHHETVQPTIDIDCGVEGRDLGAVAGDIDDADPARRRAARGRRDQGPGGSRRRCARPWRAAWGRDDRRGHARVPAARRPLPVVDRSAAHPARGFQVDERRSMPSSAHVAERRVPHGRDQRPSAPPRRIHPARTFANERRLARALAPTSSAPRRELAIAMTAHAIAYDATRPGTASRMKAATDPPDDEQQATSMTRTIIPSPSRPRASVCPGQSQTMRQAFGRLGLGMIVAVLLVYLLLVVLFQSWIDPRCSSCSRFQRRRAACSGCCSSRARR